LALAQREFRKPSVKRADGDEGAPKRNPVVKHEIDHAASLDSAKLFSRHSQELNIMRQELPAGGEK
jgi:hypothetical protein